jgi:hypothetical protein
MTFTAIIELFESVERGEDGQRIGYHLHAAIKQATDQDWPTNASYCDTFSGFLKALRAEQYPPAAQPCQCASCAVIRTAIEHGTLPAGTWD